MKKPIQIIRKREAGYSLVELLLYIGIFSMLLVFLFQLFSSIVNIQLEGESTSGVTQDGRYLLNRFTYDVQHAKSIVTPLVGSSSAQLALLISGTTNYTYATTSGNLTLTNSQTNSVDQLNSVNTSVSAFTVTHLSDTKATSTDTVTISFTLTDKTVKQGGAQVEHFQTTVGLRPQ